MSIWYVRRTGRTIGPLPASELQAAARSGQLKADDEVKDAEDPRWFVAGTVPALASLFAAHEGQTRLDDAGSNAAQLSPLQRTPWESKGPTDLDRAIGESNPFASPNSLDSGYVPTRTIQSASPALASEYAGFLQRLLASLIDGVLLILALILGLFLHAFVLSFLLGWELNEGNTMLPIQVFLWCMHVVGRAAFHCSRLQATPGKWFMSIKVTDLGGQRIDAWRSLRRGLAEFVVGVSANLLCDLAFHGFPKEIRAIVSFPFLYGSYLLVIFAPRRQALHDLLAGTLVVRR